MNIFEETQIIDPARGALRAITKSFYPEAELEELDPVALLNDESLALLFDHLRRMIDEGVTGS